MKNITKGFLLFAALAFISPLHAEARDVGKHAQKEVVCTEITATETHAFQLKSIEVYDVVEVQIQDAAKETESIFVSDASPQTTSTTAGRAIDRRVCAISFNSNIPSARRSSGNTTDHVDPGLNS